MECLEGSLLKLMPNIKSGTSRTVTNIVKKGYILHCLLKKRIPSQVCIRDFTNRYRTAF